MLTSLLMKSKKSIYFIVLVTLFSCGRQNPNTEDKPKEHDTVAATQDKSVAISEAVMNDIIQSIPSPVEMASLIKESGVEFDRQIMNSSDKMETYNTSFKKAFNIGVYGADLGYINIYEKTYSAMNYVNAIKRLADDIKVGQFFNFETLKRLVSNNKNIDSIMYISTSGLNNMDNYLRQQKRGNLSVLMISGAWLEALHIACSVIKDKPIKEIVERIGEQKIILDNLMIVLRIYQDDAYFANAIKLFDNIKKEFDQVTISYEYSQPEAKEVNGELVIVDNSRSQVNITPALVNSITIIVDEVREKLTGL